MQELNTRLTSEDKILFLWETKGYYCEIPCLPDVIIDRLRYLTALEGSAENVWRRLLDEGYTYILMFDSGLEYMIDFSQGPDTVFVHDQELALWADLKAQHLDKQYGNDHYTLYRVRE
jgi:hypothetical protein